MDDWFTIVLAFIFFVLPFLEGVLKKRRQGGGPPPGSHHPGLPPPAGTRSSPQLGTGDPAENSSWSDDWGSWPGEESGEVEDELERAPSWSTPNQPDRFGAEARTPEASRFPAETSSRTTDVVVLPEVGQPSELQRLQDLATRLDRVARADTVPIPVAVPTAPRVEPAMLKRRRSYASTLLKDRASVRRALIASEVLGPPLSMRDPLRD